MLNNYNRHFRTELLFQWQWRSQTLTLAPCVTVATCQQRRRTYKTDGLIHHTPKKSCPKHHIHSDDGKIHNSRDLPGNYTTRTHMLLQFLCRSLGKESLKSLQNAKSLNKCNHLELEEELTNPWLGWTLKRGMLTDYYILKDGMSIIAKLKDGTWHIMRLTNFFSSFLSVRTLRAGKGFWVYVSMLENEHLCLYTVYCQLPHTAFTSSLSLGLEETMLRLGESCHSPGSRQSLASP